MEVYKTVEKAIAERRISIAEAARRCGLADSTIRSIIDKKYKSVTLDVAFKLSDGLGIPLLELNGDPLGEFKQYEGLAQIINFPEKTNGPAADDDSGLSERLKIFKSLSPEAQKMALDYMAYLANREASKE